MHYTQYNSRTVLQGAEPELSDTLSIGDRKYEMDPGDRRYRFGRSGFGTFPSLYSMVCFDVRDRMTGHPCFFLASGMELQTTQMVNVPGCDVGSQ